MIGADPRAALTSLSLFDGGKRHAAVANARAELAGNDAKYRETVLTAFQQVEDELALLHHLGEESKNLDDALASASSVAIQALRPARAAASA
ncbi:hypothetical protein Bcen2424_0170 [Burkholderia cenocepacia HI2424]|nr:hypothetical protein Bcen2424_0170 [Burkholderia cenocepacia HI2424]